MLSPLQTSARALTVITAVCKEIGTAVPYPPTPGSFLRKRRGKSSLSLPPPQRPFGNHSVNPHDGCLGLRNPAPPSPLWGLGDRDSPPPCRRPRPSQPPDPPAQRCGNSTSWPASPCFSKAKPQKLLFCFNCSPRDLKEGKSFRLPCSGQGGVPCTKAPGEDKARPSHLHELNCRPPSLNHSARAEAASRPRAAFQVDGRL